MFDQCGFSDFIASIGAAIIVRRTNKSVISRSGTGNLKRELRRRFFAGDADPTFGFFFEELDFGVTGRGE